MKNKIKLIKFSLLLCLSVNVQAQLLKQGSIVATHRDGYGFNGLLTNTAVVVVLDASNTSGIPPTTVSSMFSPTIPNRYVWTNSISANPKPAWITGLGTTNWNYATLGAVFGITLDYENAGNIYIANTSIYDGELPSTHHDAIYKIDGTTGAVSTIITLAGTMQDRGIGNLKYFKSGPDQYIAFTWWEDGKIYIYKKNATGTWVQHSSFAPKFGNSVINTNIVPYGVAFRNSPTGLRIYYGEFNASVTSTSSTRIFSIPLTSTVTFSSTSEQLEITSPITVNTTPAAAIYIDRFVAVSDISFSKDNKRILVAQQSLKGISRIGAHNSRIQEYEDMGTWMSIGKYPAGYNASVNTGASSTSQSSWNKSHNAAGGISYSNNILFTDGNNNNNIKCDTTVLYTSDQIYFGQGAPIDQIENNTNFSGMPSGPYVYGIQGLPSKNTFPNDLDAFCFSLKINETIISAQDKFNLGDIEAYNPPLNCGTTQSCTCGNWGSIGLNANQQWWPGTGIMPAVSFNQGSASGLVFPHYACSTPTCNATYTYQYLDVQANGTTVVYNSTVSGNLNLASSPFIGLNLNNLPCGQDSIRITPTCNGIQCTKITIPVVINCPSVCPDCLGQSSVTITGTPSVSGGFLNLSGTVSNSISATELRILVEEFRVYPENSNENCMICKNPPKNWGSIQSANLGAVPLITTLNSLNTIDTREVVFKDITNKLFSLSPSKSFNLSLALPLSTGLPCCNLRGSVCLKFTIRDINCCEKEILKCFTFNIN